jgi:hypothetical protein
MGSGSGERSKVPAEGGLTMVRYERRGEERGCVMGQFSSYPTYRRSA